jgi:hypothetical protein
MKILVPTIRIRMSMAKRFLASIVAQLMFHIISSTHVILNLLHVIGISHYA